MSRLLTGVISANMRSETGAFTESSYSCQIQPKHILKFLKVTLRLNSPQNTLWLGLSVLMELGWGNLPIEIKLLGAIQPTEMRNHYGNDPKFKLLPSISMPCFYAAAVRNNLTFFSLGCCIKQLYPAEMNDFCVCEWSLIYPCFNLSQPPRNTRVREIREFSVSQMILQWK